MSALVSAFEDATKKWLALLAVVAIAFLGTTVYSVVQAYRDTRAAVDTELVESESSAPTPNDIAWTDGQPSKAGRIKILEMDVAPIRQPAPERPFVYPPDEEVQRQTVQDQAQYLRELSTKYPNSPFALTPKEIDEMEKKGITAY